MEDVKKAAAERAARPRYQPVGASFESERQRSKNALVRQLTAQDGSNVRRIAAAEEVPEGERILRVAAYCRVSTDDIDQAISINLQMQQYRKKIKENPQWKYAGTYVDNGFSGTNTEHRQGFQKLMRDAMDGKIDMIITKAVSRFARNLMDCIGWVEKLQNHDPPIRVYFEQENLDTMSQTSGIILFVLAMVAQEESHMKSEATLLSIEWRFSRGRFLTPRLFGYDLAEVPDGFGGKKKMLVVNEQEARVIRWMYAKLLNGSSPEEIAAWLTDLAIPTGGRRRNGTLNTHWSAGGIVAILRNEKYCGDVLARKTYTPNYKDHRSKRNNGKKNKYFQPDHHEAVVDRATWNAAQRILNSRKYRHKGVYQPMRVIDRGVLAGYISMNRSWAGFDYRDYHRASLVCMGLLDDRLEEDLGAEYLPDGGKRIGLIDDHGIAQIARDLTVAEREIMDELEGTENEDAELQRKEDAAQVVQVVSGELFSQRTEPVIRITIKGITFNKACVSRLKGTERVELLFNPVERMVVVRPCHEEHPNALIWNSSFQSAVPLCRTIFDCMGWEHGCSYRVPCQTVRSSSDVYVLVFDLDSFAGYVRRGKTKPEVTVIVAAPRETLPADDGDGKSFFYPQDDEEPQEIRDLEDRFQRAVDASQKIFGAPVSQHTPAARSLGGTGEDLTLVARPLDVNHTVDAKYVDTLASGIMDDPPAPRQNTAEQGVISVDGTEVTTDE